MEWRKDVPIVHVLEREVLRMRREQRGALFENNVCFVRYMRLGWEVGKDMYIGGNSDGRRDVVQIKGKFEVHMCLEMRMSRMCCLKKGRQSYGTCMSESYEENVIVKFVSFVGGWIYVCPFMLMEVADMDHVSWEVSGDAVLYMYEVGLMWMSPKRM